MFGDGKYPETTIGKVVDRSIVRVSKKFSPEDTIEYVDISSIDNQSKTIVGTTQYLLKNAPSRAQYILQKNDILYSTVRPNLQNVAMNELEGENLVGSTGFCVLRCTDAVLPGYMWGVVTSTEFVNAMVSLASGANYPAVTDKVVLDYTIPLPTISKQREFSAFVEQLDKSKSLYELTAQNQVMGGVRCA